MSLRLGERAPEFQRRSDEGRLISLSALRGQWVVLYFFPRAHSPACTAQAQGLQAALPDFKRLGAQVIGVSTDTEARQASFRDACQLSYPLIPDGDRRLCRSYGVVGGALGGALGRLWGQPAQARRETFLIDPQGVLVSHQRDPDPAMQISAVLAELRRLAEGV